MENLIQLAKFTVLNLNFFKIYDLPEEHKNEVLEIIKKHSKKEDDILISNSVNLSKSTEKENIIRVIVKLRVIDVENESNYYIKSASYFKLKKTLSDVELKEQINTIALNMIAVKITNVLEHLAAVNNEVLYLNLHATDFLNDKETM